MSYQFQPTIYICMDDFFKGNDKKSLIVFKCSCLYPGFELRSLIITIVKCDLFFHYLDAKAGSFYCFYDTKPFGKQKSTCEFHLCCWDHVCKVNEWCLVDCFYPEFRDSTQVMVHDYCIVKCKMFSICGRLLMALLSFFNGPFF